MPELKIDKPEFKRLYRLGINDRILAEKYSCDPSTICRYRKRNGFSASYYTRSIWRLNHELPSIAEDYVNGASITDLEKKYHFHGGQISDALKHAGIDVTSVKYQLDISVLDTSTPARNYWLGMLLADGNVAKDYYQTTLALKDKEHVEKFARFFKWDGPITRDTAWDAYRATISRQELGLRLSDFGIVPAKSHIATVHDELKNCPHFWRGMVDGDGCLFNTQYGVCISLNGTYDCCKAFKEFVGTSNKIVTHDTIFRVTIAASADTLKVLNHLYKDSTPETRLDRKYEKYLQFLESRFNNVQDTI